ncbi:MAG: hypothetical protein LWX83_11090, partial [Anaerolineae bacterium]|nr:hypothetical protein [Anaerolineae bacterium]
MLAHAAIALENALHYDAVSRRLDISNEELDIKEKLIQIGQSLRPNRPLQEALNDVCSIIQTATSFQAVYVLVYDAAIKQVRRVSQASMSIPVIEQFIEKPQPWQRIQSLLKTDFKHGRSFRVPRESFAETKLPNISENEVTQEGATDILLLPLFTADRTPLGVIIMGDPQSGQFPGWATLRALDLFSIQVSMIIDSNRYITALAASLSDVEVNYGRLLQSSASSQQRIAMLLP